MEEQARGQRPPRGALALRGVHGRVWGSAVPLGWCPPGTSPSSPCRLLTAAWFLPQGLIFVVDSNDRERVQESADELQKMVSGVGGEKWAPPRPPPPHPALQQCPGGGAR